MIRVPRAAVLEAVAVTLRRLGLSPADAELSARLFAEARADGVHSHGLRRLPRFRFRGAGSSLPLVTS